ncbi:MAG: isoprenylcysteine carboxylmethyltransferase family protein [Burkholderiaceae bacterium]
MITTSIFAIGLVAGSSLLLLSIVGLLRKSFIFWPPPSKASWQYAVFWALFRTMFIALVLVCVLDFEGLGSRSGALQLTGWLLIVVGFGIATAITMKLGWSVAHGEANELKTDGWFAFSRNPIYVFSIVGMIGAVIAINSSYANWLLGLWAGMYIVAPFAEESWLEKEYGAAYRDYLRRVPRFVGWV